MNKSMRLVATIAAAAAFSAIMPTPSAQAAETLQQPKIVDNTGWINDNVTAPEDTDSAVYVLDYDQETGLWTLTTTLDKNVEAIAINSWKAKDSKREFILTNTSAIQGNEYSSPSIIGRNKATAEKPDIVAVEGIGNDTISLPKDSEYVDYTSASYDYSTGTFQLVAKPKAPADEIAETNGWKVLADGTGIYIDSFADNDKDINAASTPLVTPKLYRTLTTDVQMPIVTDKSGNKDDSITLPKNTDQIRYTKSINANKSYWKITATAIGNTVLSAPKSTDSIKVSTDDKRQVVTMVGQFSSEVDKVVAPTDTTKETTAPVVKPKAATARTASPNLQAAAAAASDEMPNIIGKLPNGTEIIQPEAPTIIDEAGVEYDDVINPGDDAGTTYKLSYNNSTGKWKMVATAKPGYILRDKNGKNVTTITTSGQLSIGSTPSTGNTPTNTPTTRTSTGNTGKTVNTGDAGSTENTGNTGSRKSTNRSTPTSTNPNITNPTATCKDFSTQEEANQALRNGNRKLDKDNNGKACETLPTGKSVNASVSSGEMNSGMDLGLIGGGIGIIGAGIVTLLAGRRRK